LARGVLVDRFDVIVDLGELDLDAVFVGPFLQDAAAIGVVPRHPPHVDAPGHIEGRALGGLCPMPEARQREQAEHYQDSHPEMTKLQH
jgi:hypothetical protein